MARINYTRDGTSPPVAPAEPAERTVDRGIPDRSAVEFDLPDDIYTDRARQTTMVREATRTSREATATREPLRPLQQNYNVTSLSLQAPEARSGFVQRWIRDGEIDKADGTHWFKKMREGWQPRDPETVPPAERRLYPSAKLTNGQSVIRVAGLVLCEMPKEVAGWREEAVNGAITNQTKSVLPSAQDMQGKGSFGPIMVTEDSERTFRGRAATSSNDDGR